MALTIDWHDIAWRLVLTMVAGGLIGFDRQEHGRPAGLRTTMLVALAACAAMIETNLLLATVGKSGDSFVNIDPMRLPLGILTGVGFIGAGAIIRRESMIIGVTTAATLWFATVVGLSFGGGQFGLGLAVLALGMIVLSGLSWVEPYLRQRHHAILILVTGPGAELVEPEIRTRLQADGYRLHSTVIAYADQARRCEYRWDVSWAGSGAEIRPPGFLGEFAARSGVLHLDWHPEAQAASRAAGS